MRHVREGREVRIRIWWGNLNEKRPLGRLGNKWDDNIKMNLIEVGWGLWTVWVWLGEETGGRLL